MKPELKKKWVDALLSGEYKQGLDYLKDNGRFCCLGVLADVSGFVSNSSTVLQDGDGEMCVLGLNKQVQQELAHLNDDGVPFDMIAGLIDEAL